MKPTPETIIIEAPDVRLYRYDSHSQMVVNRAPNKLDVTIICTRYMVYFSTLKGGMFSSDLSFPILPIEIGCGKEIA